MPIFLRGPVTRPLQPGFSLQRYRERFRLGCRRDCTTRQHRQPIGARVGSRVAAWLYVRKSAWQPRIGVQIDAASGDRDPADQWIGTFNPLFPNGVYINLSGYTAYVNFIHLKQSLTLKPTPRIQVLAAVGELWRQTTGDAVYSRPSIPVPVPRAKPESTQRPIFNCALIGP